MSDKFYLIKYYFSLGLWNEERVKKAVEKQWITAEEGDEILNGNKDIQKQ